METVLLYLAPFSLINLTVTQHHGRSESQLHRDPRASISRITYIGHHTPFALPARTLRMATWSSQPDETWGAGGDGVADIDGPVVDPDYANAENVDIVDIVNKLSVSEDDKKPQRIRKKDIEQ